LRAAYDTLDGRTRTMIANLSAEHYALHTRILLGDDAYTDEQKSMMPPAVWPLVDTHPGSGRKVLFVGVHARQIIGFSTAEARLLLSDLLEHAPQLARVYVHKGPIRDLVMWANPATVLRGRRFDLTERGELRRTTVNDTDEAMLAVAWRDRGHRADVAAYRSQLAKTRFAARLLRRIRIASCAIPCPGWPGRSQILRAVPEVT